MKRELADGWFTCNDSIDHKSTRSQTLGTLDSVRMVSRDISPHSVFREWLSPTVGNDTSSSSSESSTNTGRYSHTEEGDVAGMEDNLCSWLSSSESSNTKSHSSVCGPLSRVHNWCTRQLHGQALRFLRLSFQAFGDCPGRGFKPLGLQSGKAPEHCNASAPSQVNPPRRFCTRKSRSHARNDQAMLREHDASPTTRCDARTPIRKGSSYTPAVSGRSRWLRPAAEECSPQGNTEAGRSAQLQGTSVPRQMQLKRRFWSRISPNMRKHWNWHSKAENE
ncbi:hypothetical protein T440DRAFT_478877 [Plenodomus tracheiphilus IPT5]|uniref:Uncharacterized protein n=1 Tax=Plenodomus tracheiphilus IPT5 TaxID=1408161 RepID=A0A6A7B6P6_9PLEO|nr:hypothetical protein T440DRAFT_478877 [Plenodomus tracheiphilus IPT5]